MIPAELTAGVTSGKLLYLSLPQSVEEPAKGINTSGKCLTTVLNPVVHVHDCFQI